VVVIIKIYTTKKKNKYLWTVKHLNLKNKSQKKINNNNNNNSCSLYNNIKNKNEKINEWMNKLIKKNEKF